MVEAEQTGKGNQMTATNKDRAEWAAAALRHFQCIAGTYHDDALTDLLCDLHHWSDRENANFQNALETARMHYQAECDVENSNEYMAYFRTTAGPADDTFVADTPEQALELARKAFSEDPGKFGFSPADCGYLVLQAIRIVNEDGEELLHWMTDEYRLQLHAPELLKALESQVEAANEILDTHDEIDPLQGGIEDIVQALDHIIDDLEGLSEAARGMLVSHENGNTQIAAAARDLKASIAVAFKAIANAKGGAA